MPSPSIAPGSLGFSGEKMTIRRVSAHDLAEAAPTALLIAGLVLGLLGGRYHLLHPFTGKQETSGFIAWSLSEAKGWELSAFGAFGAMSGFALASLALVASLSGHDRTKVLIDADPGRFLVRQLVRSVWAWLAPALLALVALFTPWAWVEALFIVGACLGSAQGIVALMALSFFFRRMSDPLS